MSAETEARELWAAGSPPYRDRVAVVRDSERPHHLGLCCWDSTADGWHLIWAPSGRTEVLGERGRWANPNRFPMWPDAYSWRYVEAAP